MKLHRLHLKGTILSGKENKRMKSSSIKYLLLIFSISLNIFCASSWVHLLPPGDRKLPSRSSDTMLLSRFSGTLMVAGDEVTLKMAEDDIGKSSMIDLPVVEILEAEKTSANTLNLFYLIVGVGAICCYL